MLFNMMYMSIYLITFYVFKGNVKNMSSYIENKKNEFVFSFKSIFLLYAQLRGPPFTN